MTEAPAPFGSAASRWYYVLLKTLVERGHTVSAFAACTNNHDAEAAKSLFPACLYDLRCYPCATRTGLMAKCNTLARPYEYLFSPALRGDLRDQLRRPFDILHLEQLWCGWLAEQYAERAVINVHYLQALDRAAGRPRRLADRILERSCLRAERRLLQRYPNIGTLSEELSASISSIQPAAKVEVLPLAMDVNLYPFVQRSAPARDPIIGLIGSFTWGPTYSAGLRLVTRLWPQIRERIPRARLWLVGRGARVAMREHCSAPGIEIYENVPDTLPFFQQMDVLLYAPAAGSGVKVKILESFSTGLPVVTTKSGVEGLPPGRYAIVSDDDAGLIDGVVSLIREPSRWQEQRIAARKLVASYCDPHAAIRQWERVYEQSLRRTDPAGQCAEGGASIGEWDSRVAAAPADVSLRRAPVCKQNSP